MKFSLLTFRRNDGCLICVIDISLAPKVRRLILLRSISSMPNSFQFSKIIALLVNPDDLVHISIILGQYHRGVHLLKLHNLDIKHIVLISLEFNVIVVNVAVLVDLV